MFKRILEIKDAVVSTLAILQCSKFNIIYDYIDKYQDIQNTFTDYGYNIYKYEYYNNCINIVSKLEHLDENLYFDFNMIV